MSYKEFKEFEVKWEGRNKKNPDYLKGLKAIADTTDDPQVKELCANAALRQVDLTKLPRRTRVDVGDIWTLPFRGV
jgi:hypothetical protein